MLDLLVPQRGTRIIQGMQKGIPGDFQEGMIAAWGMRRY